MYFILHRNLLSTFQKCSLSTKISISYISLHSINRTHLLPIRSAVPLTRILSISSQLLASPTNTKLLLAPPGRAGFRNFSADIPRFLLPTFVPLKVLVGQTVATRAREKGADGGVISLQKASAIRLLALASCELAVRPAYESFILSTIFLESLLYSCISER